MPRLFIAVDIPESIRRKIAWLDVPAAPNGQEPHYRVVEEYSLQKPVAP